MGKEFGGDAGVDVDTTVDDVAAEDIDWDAVDWLVALDGVADDCDDSIVDDPSKVVNTSTELLEISLLSVVVVVVDVEIKVERSVKVEGSDSWVDVWVVGIKLVDSSILCEVEPILGDKVLEDVVVSTSGEEDELASGIKVDDSVSATVVKKIVTILKNVFSFI